MTVPGTAGVPVRVGVLGAAGFARRRMLPAFAGSPSTVLTAVASRALARAADLAGAYGARAVAGYAALLEDEEVDAVYIPLPAALHARWVRAALLAGKHVLAEKPLTLEAAETRELLTLAAARGLTLAENVLFPFHSQHAEAQRLVADGAIGRLRHFEAAFAVPRLPEGDIRYRPELGGGALWDTGVYPVRAALMALGDGLRVAGALATRGAGDRVDTSGSALLSAPSGVAAQLSYGLDHGYRNAYTYWGSAGRLTVPRAFTPPAGHRPVLVLERPSGIEELTLPADDQVANAVEAFAAAVRTGRRPGHRGDVLLRQAELVDAIRQSAGPAVPLVQP